MSLFAGVTLTLQKTQVHWSCGDELAVHAHDCSFACRSRMQNLPAGYPTVGIYCVTMTWQRIFKCPLHDTVFGDSRRRFTIRLKGSSLPPPISGVPKILGVRTISSIYVSNYICIFVLIQPTLFTMPLTKDFYRRMSAKD